MWAGYETAGARAIEISVKGRGEMQFEQLSLFDSVAMQPPQPPPIMSERVERVEKKESAHEVYCLEHPIEMIRKIKAKKDVIWPVSGKLRKWFSQGQEIDCIVVGEPGERAICGVTNPRTWSSVMIWWENIYPQDRDRGITRCDDVFFFEHFEIIEWDNKKS